MKNRLGHLLASLGLFTACTTTPPHGPAPTMAPSATPKAAASSAAVFSPSNPFDKIHDGDYAPAIEEGMRRQLAEIAAIADDPAPPTFENTIVPMERSGELLTRASRVFSNITQMDTNDSLQKIKADLAPK